MGPDHPRITEQLGHAREMDDDQGSDGGEQADSRHEQQQARERQHPRLADTERVAHVHRPLKEAWLALEAMPADGAGRVHRKNASKHATLETHGAALPQNGAHSLRAGHQAGNGVGHRGPPGSPIPYPKSTDIVWISRPTRPPTRVPLMRMNCRSLPTASSSRRTATSASQALTVRAIRSATSWRCCSTPDASSPAKNSSRSASSASLPKRDSPAALIPRSNAARDASSGCVR